MKCNEHLIEASCSLAGVKPARAGPAACDGPEHHTSLLHRRSFLAEPLKTLPANSKGAGIAPAPTVQASLSSLPFVKVIFHWAVLRRRITNVIFTTILGTGEGSLESEHWGCARDPPGTWLRLPIDCKIQPKQMHQKLHSGTAAFLLLSFQARWLLLPCRHPQGMDWAQEGTHTFPCVSPTALWAPLLYSSTRQGFLFQMCTR